MAGLILLDIKGPAVKGDSSTVDHEGWIQLNTFSIGGSQDGTFQSSGKYANRGQANVQDLFCTKVVDASSALLMNNMMGGEPFDEATLRVLAITAGKPEVLYEIVFKHIIVSSYNVTAAADGGGDIGESVSFNFEEVSYDWTKRDNKGRAEGKVRAAWNTREGQAKG